MQVACASWTLLWLGTGGSAGSIEAGLPAGAVGLAVGVLGIVWLSNLYNFMDGIDGIAGGQAAATGAVMTFLLARGGDMGLALLAAVIAGASLGFLIWNWSPALIFMGDVGSGFLGFIFGAIAVAGAREGAVPLLLCAERSPWQCHRRVIAESVAEKVGCRVLHLPLLPSRSAGRPGRSNPVRSS